MDDIRNFIASEFHDPEARRQYAEELLDAYIALQIKTLRLQRKWTQAELAERAGKRQSQISAMEQTDFASWKVSTLRKLAEAFDLALVVRFESFGAFLRDSLDVSRSALERPSFADDAAFSASTSPESRARSADSQVVVPIRGRILQFATSIAKVAASG